jgi:ribosomal protein L3 glutamine methyltransferase
MSFIVDERVLIPRSPIGELIEKRFEPWLAADPARILDLCTGSGCIGISCADVFPNAEVVLADLSFEALEVANQNIERHGLEERVYSVQGDGFAGLPNQRFDLIVSNPPYVDAEDFADMPEEFHHEPELGLACGDDGLDLVRRMLAEAADHLNDKGLLIVEVGNSQVHVQDLYPEVDFAWLEFARGGHGVFMLTAEQCRQHQGLFASRV